MKTMKIFEPAMCCPTGLCGVGVDPELLRVSTVLNTLKENGVEVQRYNLTSAPNEFVNHKAVAEFLQKFGPDKLPVTLVEDVIVIAGRYPSNEEFVSWLDVSPDVLGISSCYEDSSCCSGSEEEAEAAPCCCNGDTESSDCCDGEAEAPGCCSGEAAGESCCEDVSSSAGNDGGCCSGCC